MNFEQDMLKQLHRAKTLNIRSQLITDLEEQGYTVEFLRNRYVLSLNGIGFTLPDKVCEHCKKKYLLEVFWGAQGTEHPWCKGCRKEDPVNARKAFDHARFHKDYQNLNEEERATLWRKVQSRKIKRGKSKASD